MFSGIIKTTAKAQSTQKEDGGLRFVFPIPSDWKLSEGESINIDGICSTAEKVEKDKFQVYFMPETLKVTSLSTLKKDHVFNLELCLTLNDLIGGHLVYGHVDCRGKVSRITDDKDGVTLEITIPASFTRYIVYKGSVAVNGVSLTVVSVSNNSFCVSLIPYTLSNTNLSQLETGDLVNIEVDMLAKHIEKLLKK
jgi:riboflavin synthase